MDLFDLTADQRRLVLAAVRYAGLDDSYQSFVARHLDVADGSWRFCCASNCDPCVNTLARAVDRARRDLGIRPPGLCDRDNPG